MSNNPREEGLTRRDFLIKGLKFGGGAAGALFGVGRAAAQEGRPHLDPSEASHGNGEPEVAQVSTPSTENLNGKPAFQEIEGQGVEGYYSVTASIDEIVVGTYQEPLSFPIGDDLIGGAFAICSYEGKSGLQQVAIPLAFVSTTENKTYVNKGPEGIVMWDFQFGIPEVTTLALDYAVTPNEGKEHISIAFRDASGKGLGNTENIKPVIDNLYPTGSLVNFITKENSADLPGLGSVNGVPILMTDFSVFIS